MSEYDLANINVLIVDDYQPIRYILRGILREFGIANVVDKANGREALEALKAFPADVLITDYSMFPIDGLELAETIRSGEAGVDPYLPIILITAYTEMDIILRARDAGVNEFLAKPISAKLVYYRLRSIIENPRPFVRAEEFFGPDRRRRVLPVPGQERRDDKQGAKGSERQEDRG